MSVYRQLRMLMPPAHFAGIFWKLLGKSSTIFLPVSSLLCSIVSNMPYSYIWVLFSFPSQLNWNNKPLDQADWSPANTVLPVLRDAVYLFLEAAGRDENITSAPKPFIFLPRNSKTLEIHSWLHKENENSFSNISTEVGSIRGTL